MMGWRLVQHLTTRDRAKPIVLPAGGKKEDEFPELGGETVNCKPDSCVLRENRGRTGKRRLNRIAKVPALQWFTCILKRGERSFMVFLERSKRTIRS